MLELPHLLTLVGVIVFVGFLGELIFRKTNIPSMIWLIFFGILLGPVFKVLDPSVFSNLSPLIGSIALIVILFEAGVSMDIYKMIHEFPRGVLMAVISFLFTVSFVTAGAYFFYGWPLLNGILLGSIIGGASSAIVIPTITRTKGVSEDTRVMLALESVITDVLCIVVSVAMLDILIAGGSMSIAFQSIASAFSIGAVMGVIAGFFWVLVLKKVKKEKNNYVLTLAFLFLLYPMVEMLKGAGGIACLTFGVILGNVEAISSMLKLKKKDFFVSTNLLQYFHHQITFFISAFFFVFLGLVLEIKNPAIVWYGLLFTILAITARPLAVHLISLVSEMKKKDKYLMSMMFPRGLAAAILANFTITYGIPDAGVYSKIAFIVILATAIICTIGVTYIETVSEKDMSEEQD